MSAILVLLLQLFSLVLIARAVFSWLPIGSDSAVAPVRSFVYGVAEPVLAPVRQALPRFGALDLSVGPVPRRRKGWPSYL